MANKLRIQKKSMKTRFFDGAEQYGLNEKTTKTLYNFQENYTQYTKYFPIHTPVYLNLSKRFVN